MHTDTGNHSCSCLPQLDLLLSEEGVLEEFLLATVPYKRQLLRNQAASLTAIMRPAISFPPAKQSDALLVTVEKAEVYILAPVSPAFPIALEIATDLTSVCNVVPKALFMAYIPYYPICVWTNGYFRYL